MRKWDSFDCSTFSERDRKNGYGHCGNVKNTVAMVCENMTLEEPSGSPEDISPTFARLNRFFQANELSSLQVHAFEFGISSSAFTLTIIV